MSEHTENIDKLLAGRSEDEREILLRFARAELARTLDDCVAF